MQIDISSTIISKSEELTADDIMAKPITITITKVSINNSDRPVVINFQNDRGKPYKPAKCMRRVLVAAWGADGANYVGKSLTLYRDPTVLWAGVAVGGIRISHMSDIAKKLTLPLSFSKGKKVLFTVEPLKVAPREKASIEDIGAEVKRATSVDELNYIYKGYRLQENAAKVAELCKKRKAELLTAISSDDFLDDAALEAGEILNDNNSNQNGDK